MANVLSLQARALYDALSTAIGEDEQQQARLDAAYDILDILIEELED